MVLTSTSRKINGLKELQTCCLFAWVSELAQLVMRGEPEPTAVKGTAALLSPGASSAL